MAQPLPQRPPVRLLPAVLLTVACALVGCGGGNATAPTSTHATSTAAWPTRPNIVFVLTDDLSTDLVRYMPHVQAMSRRGVTFTRYVVTDSLCCPSRSSIFSGRFPHDTGVFTNVAPDGGFGVFHDRGEERSTFATDLHAAGYRTAMMGKYLNGYEPRSSPGSSTGYVPPGWDEWDVAGRGYREFDYDLNENGHVVHHGFAPADYLTDVVAGKGADFIDRSAAAGRPFMLEIATFAPHAPYTPAPRDANRFPGLGAPRGPAFNRQNANPPSWLGRRPPLRRRALTRIDASYRKRAQAVQAVDAMIGRLESTLAAHGLSQSTYLVFSSDNGYHMGEHRLRPGKMTAFDSDIRVPLIVVGPGVPAGRKVDDLVENIDLRPTFSALGSASVPAEVDGHSLVALLHGGQGPGGWRDAALVEHHGPDRARRDPDRPGKGAGTPTTYEAIRTASAVYVEYANGEREYYDGGRDPNELTNTAASLSADERATLHGRLTALSRCHGARQCWAAGHRPP